MLLKPRKIIEVASWSKKQHVQLHAWILKQLTIAHSIQIAMSSITNLRTGTGIGWEHQTEVSFSSQEKRTVR